MTATALGSRILKDMRATYKIMIPDVIGRKLAADPEPYDGKRNKISYGIDIDLIDSLYSRHRVKD